MITLITGEPGNGKTCHAVELIDEFLRKEDRPLLCWGVTGLKLPHDRLPPVAQWTTEVASEDDATIKRHVFTWPEGALVVIDEAQDVFRPRGVGSKVPPVVQALETHRHLGLDVLLITQKPGLIDSNVRALVGKHVHVRSNWAGRKLFEWSECRSPSNRTDLSEAVTRSWKLPARVFALYESASLHVKVKRRLPRALAVGIGAALVVAGGGLYMGTRVWDLGHGAAVRATAPPRGDGGGASALAVPSVSPPVQQVRPPPAPTGGIRAHTFVRVGERVLVDRYQVVLDDGHAYSVDGGNCSGEDRAVECHFKGALMRWESTPRTETPNAGQGQGPQYAKR